MAGLYAKARGLCCMESFCKEGVFFLLSICENQKKIAVRHANSLYKEGEMNYNEL